MVPISKEMSQQPLATFSSRLVEQRLVEGHWDGAHPPPRISWWLKIRGLNIEEKILAELCLKIEEYFQNVTIL